MTQNQMKRYKYIMAGLGGGLIFAVLLAIDLGTKMWAEWYEFAYGLNQPSYFLGFIKLTYTQNRGIAFGIASDDPLIMSIIIAVTVLLALLLIVAFFTIFRNNTQKASTCPLAIAMSRASMAVPTSAAIGTLAT